MPKGVFNPYEVKKPKKEFKASFDPNNPLNTEYSEESLGDIKLDGDSHVLEFKNLALEDVPTRLGALIREAYTNHRAVLIRHGIDLLDKGDPRNLEENEAALPTPEGYVCVYVSDQNNRDQAKTEVEIFRRIANALQEIPRTLLVRHQARIIVRA